MGKSKAPKPPDPYQTALAQAKMNQSTAGYEQLMNMVNQVGPDGSLTYSQSGYYDYTDPFTGKTVKVPRMTATQSLSEAQQGIKGQTDAAQYNLASILKGLTGNIQGTLDKPLSLDNEATEARLFELGSKRLRPQLDQNRQRAETDAINRGIRPGSDAYDRLMRGVGEQENDAWNQLVLTGRGQAVNELLTERNQPYKEIAALLSGAQIDQPNFINTPGADLANTDYAGLVNQGYQDKLAEWQQKNQSLNQALGGMFGLAGNVIKYSDRRLKKDVEKVGKTEDDLGIYKFRYKGGGPMRLGLIAQDVEKKMPGAVSKDPHGFRRVDYRKALHLGV